MMMRLLGRSMTHLLSRNSRCATSPATVSLTQFSLVSSSIPSIHSICRGISRSSYNLTSTVLKGKDPQQAASFEQESCPIVDDQDNVIGSRSKRDCHLMTNIRHGLLHRAFSVLLFDSKGNILMTERSANKITFPGYLTNACCSHPSCDPMEIEVSKDFTSIKRAAQRRLQFELGIDPKDLPLEDIHFMTRFIYQAVYPDDPVWGEHELDYVLLIHKDLPIKPNPDEVSFCQFVSRSQLESWMEQAENGDLKVTQWFYKIYRLWLDQYWDNLHQLHKVQDHNMIHKELVKFRDTYV